MKQTLFFLLALFISCSKDSSNTFCRLSGIQADGYSEVYTYNQAGQVISYSNSNGESHLYNYGKNGLVTTDYYTDSNPEDSVTYNYIYDTNNKLIKINTWNISKEFTYNSSNQIIKIQFYGSDNGVFVPVDYYILSYSSTNTKNFSTIIWFNSSIGATSSNSRQYDSKPNPTPISTDLVVPFVTTNNVIKTAGDGYTFTYGYAYNSKGYPHTVTEGSYVLTYNYTNCQ